MLCACQREYCLLTLHKRQCQYQGAGLLPEFQPQTRVPKPCPGIAETLSLKADLSSVTVCPIPGRHCDVATTPLCLNLVPSLITALSVSMSERSESTSVGSSSYDSDADTVSNSSSGGEGYLSPRSKHVRLPG